MSIDKYKKSTPDLTIPNSSWFSTDNSDLRCYKLVNAQNIGLEWCYATNYNNTKRYDKTYINVGDKTSDTSKTGLYTDGIEQTTLYGISMYKVNIVDDNFDWDKVGAGIAIGLLHNGNTISTSPNYNNLYVIDNLDYSKIVVTTSGYTTGLGLWNIDNTASDRISTRGMYITVKAFDRESRELRSLPSPLNLNLFFGTVAPEFTFIDRLGNDSAIEPQIQIGVRGFRDGYSKYVNQVFEKPYTTNGGYNIAYCMATDTQYVQSVVLPLNEFAKFTEKVAWHASSGDIYGAFFTECPNCDDIIKALNSTGLYYADDSYTSWGDFAANVHLGVMDANGVTDCENRITGLDEIDNSDLPNKNRSGYDWDIPDPTKPPTPPIPEIDDIESVGYGYFSNTTMGTLYALKNKLDLEKITQWLLTQTEKIDIAKNVVSLKEIPFPLSTLGITPIDANLSIGGTPVTYQGANVVVGEIVAPVIPTLSVVFADFDIPRMSNTFLDYSPYTKYELLVPFAPSPISLPDWCVNKNVKAIFLYDIYTTACQYVIECNGERICSVSGNFGIDRPISAQNVAIKDASRLSSQISTASSVLGGVMSGATSNVGGIISGAVGGVSALSQMILSGKQNYMYTVGANGDSSTVGLYHAAHLKITRTLSAEDDNFAHVYGRPLCKVRKLSDLTGYTKCDNVNTSGLTCSESEKQMIKNLLESGVHI